MPYIVALRVRAADGADLVSTCIAIVRGPGTSQGFKESTNRKSRQHLGRNMACLFDIGNNIGHDRPMQPSGDAPVKPIIKFKMPSL